jgi:preprotein translocase subunit SecA
MEAEIIAKAGQRYAVTIATNMAGRGTDIVLGEGVAELGGLHVLGTERHEARRIDNQLRGRSGRQGDPGSSRFYISFKDDLMRIFAQGGIVKLIDSIDTEGEPLTTKEGHLARMVSKSIETAQKRVESHNFEIRKHLLEYDNVMNRQREVIYDERRRVLFGEDLKDYMHELIEEVVDAAFEQYVNEKVSADQWDIDGLRHYLDLKLAIKTSDIKLEDMRIPEMKDVILERMKSFYGEKEGQLGAEMLRHLERMVLLQVVDTKWKDHLYAMDSLREGIGLRAYGQRDPLVEYQHEAYAMFMDMIGRIKEETVEYLFKIQAIKEESKAPAFDASKQRLVHEEKSQFQDLPAESAGEAASYEGQLPEEKVQTFHREAPKIGRNDPCTCGSGKKYKKCCGK